MNGCIEAFAVINETAKGQRMAAACRCPGRMRGRSGPGARSVVAGVNGCNEARAVVAS